MTARLDRSILSIQSILSMSLLLALAGCSSEGGVVGSGISGVSGNIVLVELEPESADEGSGAAVPAVEVRIEEAGISTTSDAEGNFVLEGDFAGQVTVAFREPGGARDLDAVRLDVAEGSRVFLPDIEIRRDLDEVVQVRAPLHFHLVGRVNELGCEEGLMTVTDESPRRNVFVLRLNEGSDIELPNGTPLVCEQLAPADRIALEEGVLQIEEGVIEVVKLLVDPGSRRELPEQIRIRRAGIVLAVRCDRPRFVAFADTGVRDLVRAELGTDARIECDDPDGCACEEIMPDDRIEILAVRNPRRPTGVEVVTLRFASPPADVTIEAQADIVDLDCDAGVIGLREPRSAANPDPELRVLELRASTEYRCPGHRPQGCGCDDFRPDDRVGVRARLSPGLPSPAVVLAMQLRAVPRRRLEARLIEPRCGMGLLLVRGTGNEELPVGILDAARFEDARGNALACTDLVPNDMLRLEVVETRRSDAPVPLVTDRVILRGRPRMAVQPENAADGAAEIAGNVLSVDCENGWLRLLSTEGERRTVAISEETRFANRLGDTRCGTVALGNALVVSTGSSGTATSVRMISAP